jgi:hypothetical protein
LVDGDGAIFSAGAFLDAGFDCTAGLSDFGAPCEKAVPEPATSAATAVAINSVFFLMMFLLESVLWLFHGPPRVTDELQTVNARCAHMFRLQSTEADKVSRNLLPIGFYLLPIGCENVAANHRAYAMAQEASPKRQRAGCRPAFCFNRPARACQCDFG